MVNCNVLILGRTGSGKTTFARSLLALAPRAIVLDFMRDPMWDGIGTVFFDFRSFTDFYREYYAADFQAVFRSMNRESYFALFDVVFEFQRAYDPGPIAFFVEESTLFSGSHMVDENFEKVVVMGRREKISVISIAQRDTQINPIIRANSFHTVTLNQKKFSTDMKDIFSGAELDQILALKVLTPLDSPTYAVHYITDPPGVDIHREFARAMLFENHGPYPLTATEDTF